MSQALLTNHANRFALDRVHVTAYTDTGLAITITHPDDSSDEKTINRGETIELGGEKWFVQSIIPGITIAPAGQQVTKPRAIALLETNI